MNFGPLSSSLLFQCIEVIVADKERDQQASLACGPQAGNSDESGASVPNRKLMLLSPRSRKRTPQETQSASNAKQ
eukprot:scaffold77321_cov21-Tisochrysis_lutea.AAC.1